MSKILYREVVGAGNDTEANNPNGIVVTLSYWDRERNFNVPDHYLIQRIVMINREIVVDDIQLVRPSRRWRSVDDPAMIRRAIATMDELKELNPEAEAVTQ